jgi:hypothetical protein
MACSGSNLSVTVRTGSATLQCFPVIVVNGKRDLPVMIAMVDLESGGILFFQLRPKKMLTWILESG